MGEEDSLIDELRPKDVYETANKRNFLNTQINSPLRMASFHKIKAIHDSLPDPREVVPNPRANNQKQERNLKVKVSIVQNMLCLLRDGTNPNEIKISIATQSFHSASLVLSEMLLLLTGDYLPPNSDVFKVIFCCLFMPDSGGSGGVRC